METEINEKPSSLSNLIVLLFLLSNVNLYCIHIAQFTDTPDSVVELKNQAHIIYHFENDNSYRISWGNKQFKTTSHKTFQKQGNGCFSIVSYNDNVVILEQISGPSIKYSLILPLKEGMVEQIYINPLAYNLDYNLIAFSDSHDDFFLSVKNYLSGNEVQINIEDMCPAVVSKDCIEKIIFNKNNLLIIWQGKRWSPDEEDLKRMTVKLKL